MEVWELREKIFLSAKEKKAQTKNFFDQRTKANDFQEEDMVLKWDAKKEKKGLHEKFDHLWWGPFKIVVARGRNAFMLKNLDDTEFRGGHVNGQLLKHYFPLFVTEIPLHCT